MTGLIILAFLFSGLLLCEDNSEKARMARLHKGQGGRK